VLLVVSNESRGLVGDLLEDVVDEGVHDGHGSLGDTSLGVNLLEDSVDVDGEGLGSLGSSLWCNSGLRFLCWGVSSGFTCHLFKLFVIISQKPSVINQLWDSIENIYKIVDFNWLNFKILGF